MHRAVGGALVGALAALGAQPAAALCLITPIDPTGVLAVDGAYETLDSEAPSGASTQFRVLTALFSYELEVDVPAAFVSAPAGGGQDVVYAVTFSTTGVTLLDDVLAGVGVPLGIGVTTVTVDARAEKTAGVFAAGDYQLEVTARCVL